MTFPSPTGRRSARPAVAFRLALKGLRRSGGTTLLAVLVLTLGLAAPAVFFSLLVGAVRPLPVPDGHRMVRIDIQQPERSGRELNATLEDVGRMGPSPSLQRLGAYRTFTATLVDPGLGAVRLALAAMTAEAFLALDVQPTLGRLPTPDDAERTILLGHDVWRDSYDLDPSVLGRVVGIDGQALTVTGVMPEGFGFPLRQDAWTVIAPGEPTGSPVDLFGRLAPGATAESATAELGARWRQGDAQREAERVGGVVAVQPYTGSRGESGEGMAFVGLVLIALCLLMIACSNVANLLLVRATERVRALAIQSALGAARLQIGMQIFFEAIIIAAAGGAAGLVLATVTVDTLERLLGGEHWGYYWMRMAVDGPVLVFTAGLVMATALVAGTLPIVRVLRVDVQGVLKEESTGAAVGGGGAWSRAFVTAQLALSCSALVAAGITSQALNGVTDLAGDLATENILMGSVAFAHRTDESPRLAGAIAVRLSSLPGVVASAMATGAPGYFEAYGPFELGGVTYERPEDRDRVTWSAVTDGYFTVFDQTLLAGRSFSDRDDESESAVAMVNESFARRFGSERDVVGRSLRLTTPTDSTWRTIVGVVSDAPVGGGERGQRASVYLSLPQTGGPTALMLVRASRDVVSLAPSLRQTMADVDPALPVDDLRTLRDGHAFMTRIPRAMALLALGGGLAGLFVAAAGLYGLLAFRVRQRRRELGVRLALGADGRRLALETVTVAARQLVPAIALGLILTWMAAPALGVIALGGDTRSPGTYLGVAITFFAIGLVAAVVPAVRAAATDPAHVLRGG